MSENTRRTLGKSDQVKGKTRPVRQAAVAPKGVKMKATNPFKIGCNIKRWSIFPELGEILPELVPYPDVPGLQGRREKGTIISQREDLAKKKGWILFDERDLMELYPEGYCHSVPSITRERGQVYYTPWQIPRSGASKLDVDLVEYKRCCDFLLDNGWIELPTKDDLIVQRGRIEVFIVDATKHQQHQVVKKLQAQLDVIDSYLNEEVEDEAAEEEADLKADLKSKSRKKVSE